MASNFSIVERVKYGKHLTRQDVLDIIDEMQQQCDATLSQNIIRDDSFAWEQVGFARDLLDEIVDILKQETRSPKAIKSAILAALENSLFER